MTSSRTTNAWDTPLRNNGLSDAEKRARLEQHFRGVMETLGLDLRDGSLANTPARLARLYVDELFSGLKPNGPPAMMTVENTFGYDEMVTESNITVHSVCEHHFVPIIGHAHVSYIARDRLVGLSKLHQVVDHFARRPQIQERLTVQIAETLRGALDTDDVAVVVDAVHHCVRLRGVRHTDAITRTSALRGLYESNRSTRAEFMKSIPAIPRASSVT